MKPHLILVGGFLGAGKTTLIVAAARLLADRGLRSAVILNDQGESLVDAELARSTGLEAGEVTGGCFCCRFSELMRVAETLRETDVIFAEPVGSCTDLSATILHPIQEAFAETYQLAPLTILVDPGRPHDNPDIEFLFQKQLEEAGQLALSGKILDIDYTRYAQAEAALAWLNAEADLACDPPLSPALLLGPLLDTLDHELTAARIPIVHLKALDRTPTGSLKAAVCSNGQEPVVEGALDASPSTTHHILLNLRAASAPEPVRAIVEKALKNLPGLAALRLNCFSPSPPKPEKRHLPPSM
jgi:CobW/HypB/UreG, nucleotide-binding domain